MSNWWQTIQEALKHAKLVLTHPWPVWAVAPILMGCVILIVYLYSKERRVVAKWVGHVLLGIRTLLVILVLLMLLEPVLSTDFDKPVRGVVVVGVDKSLSMSIATEVNSNGNKLMVAEALGVLPANVRSRGPNDLAQACVAVLKLYNEDVSPKLLTYLRQLQAVGGKPDAQTGKYRDEALVAANAFVTKVTEIARSARDVSGVYATNAPTPCATLVEKAKTIDELFKDEWTTIGKRLNPPAATGEGASSPVSEVEFSRKSLEKAEPHLRAIIPLAFQLQRVADDVLAVSNDGRVKDALAKVNKLTRAEQIYALLGSSHTKLLERLLANNDVRVLAFDTETKTVPLPNEITDASLVVPIGKPDGVATALSEPLRRAVDLLKGEQQLTAVVLISDGQHNRGIAPQDFAASLAQRKIPLYTIGIGDTEPPKDISIAKAEGSETVFKSDKAMVEITITAVGFPNTDIPVVLEREGKKIADTKVRLKEGETTTDAKLTFTPDWDGEATCQVSAPVQPGEFLPDNNRRDIRITVITDKLKVLLVDRDPRWEYIYLKRDLERDKYVNLNTILLSRYRDGQMPRGDQPGQFPANLEQIYKYKMIVIGDLLPESLSEADQKNIKSYVEDNGGVLVVISGKDGMPARFRNEILADLLPVIPSAHRVDWKPPGDFLHPFRIQLTAEGRDEGFLSLNPDPVANADAWARLPAMFWFAPVQQLKPGASALVVVRPPDWLNQPAVMSKLGDTEMLLDSMRLFRNEGVPLIATQGYDLGKVLWLGTDATWRWRYKVADEHFHRFWGQVLRWSTTGHLTGRDKYIMMGTRKAEYEENEPVMVEARILYPNPNSPLAELIPLDNATEIFAVIYAGGDTKALDAKEVNRVRMQQVKGRGGFYRGEFPGFKGGDYFVRLIVPQLPPRERKEEAVSAFHVIRNPGAEFYNVTLNEPLLKELANRGGGKYFDLSNASTLADEIKRNPKTERVHAEIEAWNHWIFLALFCGLLVAEWTLRKWKGLL